ncbi:MAG: hypothetical protein FJW96_04600 [Actinobacteria bacterium]|nr:hypothetical protein [Actinomycetota bacterium]
MREQSQKKEMADALRGDFQRLRRRGVATTLGPSAEEDGGGAGEPPAQPAETPARETPPAAAVEPAEAVGAPDEVEETRESPPEEAGETAVPVPAVAEPVAAREGPSPDLEDARPAEMPVEPASDDEQPRAGRRSLLGRLVGRG